MSMMRNTLGLLLTAALLPPAQCLLAGDIVGTVKASKPFHVVVYVEKVPGQFGGNTAIMDQLNKVFIPYVLAVVQGSKVEFQNSDELQHNVFGVGADEFDLGNWTKGIMRSHTFNRLGDVVILCNVHPEMEAHILVLQNPYFAQPDSEGKFHIGDVPAGEYVLKAWYRGKTKKQTVKVSASGSVTADF